MVYDSLNLYISGECFTFEPLYADPGVRRETLVVDRDTGMIRLNGVYCCSLYRVQVTSESSSGLTSQTAQFNGSAPPAPTLRQEEVITIYGLIGIIKLNSGEEMRVRLCRFSRVKADIYRNSMTKGDHLVLITDRDKIGKINGKEIFKLTRHKIIPVQRSRLHLSDQQIKDDETYVTLLSQLLGSGFFYFSYDYDLTHTLQRQAEIGEVDKRPIWQRADERFFWNRHMQKRLIDHCVGDVNLSNFILPIICGFVEINHCTLNGKSFIFALISRRSQYRAGTRYHSRGIDEKGNVSNFVETEQLVILESTGQKASYVQTRGSIPLFWKQVVNAKYQPKLVVEPHPKTAESFRKHFTEQIQRYGDQIVVNLVNTHGYELPMGQEFARQIKSMNDPRVRYVHFDFHRECKRMRWDRISLLIDQIQPQLETQGYCLLDGASKVVRQQTSVVRTNCMDCLDRTNVVQSVLARRALNLQLRELNVLGPNERVEDTGDFEKLFKHVWADNADEISRQYSGTGALKTDFTRTGKRTKAGALQDLSNSLMRYFKNNYLDGGRQDAFDLFLGLYQVDPTGKSPYMAAQRPLRVILLPLVVIFSIFMILLTLLVPPESTFYTLVSISVWLGVIFIAHRTILRYGTDFVDLPRLNRSVGLDYRLAKGIVEPYSTDVQMSELGNFVASGQATVVAEGSFVNSKDE
ncbi:Phosphatidylinositide phosphatase SAC1 [Borealophlyctis nickersoniae]|nr:Phosphatidylinositide phosphatase SAC1 [Borealophlyctis nickersoniae]